MCIVIFLLVPDTEGLSFKQGSSGPPPPTSPPPPQASESPGQVWHWQAALPGSAAGQQPEQDIKQSRVMLSGPRACTVAVTVTWWLCQCEWDSSVTAPVVAVKVVVAWTVTVGCFLA